MRFIFFGGGESKFAQIILDKLVEAGLSPIESFRNAKSPLDADYLKSLNADFFLVASFAKILKKEIIEIPSKGAIAVHPSLLPKYRGASPVQSAILNNEKETGTTIFLIDEKVDHGAILAMEKIKIENSDNYETMIEKLAGLSADLLIKTLPDWANNKIKPETQNEAEATYTKKFVSEDAYCDLTKDSPEKIWLKIRALNPEPGAFTTLNLINGKSLRLKLLKASFIDKKLQITEVQPEGKKIMAAREFLNGHKKLLSAEIISCLAG